jgi:hypothetical protein
VLFGECCSGLKVLLAKNVGKKLFTHGIDLQTLKRKNMKETRSKEFLKWLVKTRKTIEAGINILTEQFRFNHPKARTIHHFVNKTSRKILAYNFTIILKIERRVIMTNDYAQCFGAAQHRFCLAERGKAG